jgi:ribonucleotide monophosphatase NagD (HAD superfamily)
MEIKDSVLSIAGDYEAVFVDVYGVLYDGVALYERVPETMAELKTRGKKVVLLSNLTLTSAEAETKYKAMGMERGKHYDRFVTSGEFVRDILQNRPNEFSDLIGEKLEAYKCLFMANTALFDTGDLKEVDASEADFIYVGLPRSSYGAVRIDDVYDYSSGAKGKKIDIENVVKSDWHKVKDSQGREGLREFAFQLEACLRMNKTLLIANPDIFSRSSQKNSSKPAAVITQGGIGAYYEKLGGKVVYFGKPYPGIYKYALQSVNCVGSAVMIGDTPWTDIAGANGCGLDSALVIETGVTDEFFKGMNSSLATEEKCRLLLEKIASKMAGKTVDVKPKHFIKRFAEKR